MKNNFNLRDSLLEINTKLRTICFSVKSIAIPVFEVFLPDKTGKTSSKSTLINDPETFCKSQKGWVEKDKNGKICYNFTHYQYASKEETERTNKLQKFAKSRIISWEHLVNGYCTTDSRQGYYTLACAIVAYFENKSLQLVKKHMGFLERNVTTCGRHKGVVFQFDDYAEKLISTLIDNKIVASSNGKIKENISSIFKQKVRISSSNVIPKPKLKQPKLKQPKKSKKSKKLKHSHSQQSVPPMHPLQYQYQQSLPPMHHSQYQYQQGFAPIAINGMNQHTMPYLFNPMFPFAPFAPCNNQNNHTAQIGISQQLNATNINHNSQQQLIQPQTLTGNRRKRNYLYPSNKRV